MVLVVIIFYYFKVLDTSTVKVMQM